MSARLEDYFTARDRGALKKRGITSVADLFRFFPRRFLVPGEKTPLGGLRWAKPRSCRLKSSPWTPGACRSVEAPSPM